MIPIVCNPSRMFYCDWLFKNLPIDWLNNGLILINFVTFLDGKKTLLFISKPLLNKCCT